MKKGSTVLLQWAEGICTQVLRRAESTEVWKPSRRKSKLQGHPRRPSSVLPQVQRLQDSSCLRLDQRPVGSLAGQRTERQTGLRPAQPAFTRESRRSRIFFLPNTFQRIKTLCSMHRWMRACPFHSRDPHLLSALALAVKRRGCKTARLASSGFFIFCLGKHLT